MKETIRLSEVLEINKPITVQSFLVAFVGCFFLLCVSCFFFIGHRSYGKYLVVKISENIVGEANSQL